MGKRAEHEKSVEAAVAEAARSDLLWELGTLGAMKHFKLRHPHILEAKARALQLRPVAVGKAMARLQSDRQFDRCVRGEVRYPQLDVMIAAGSECDAEVARRYELTRARVGQMRRELEGVARARGLSLVRVAEQVADQARKLSPAA